LISNVGNRSASWLGTISEELEENGPLEFSRGRLDQQTDLFAHRAALFYNTATANIPSEYVGFGSIDITLPVASPDYIDFFEVTAYRSPRFWVDLIQRETGKLRWKPLSPANVSFVRYDCFAIRPDHLCLGTKAILDALKVGITV
jgi:hypothetical protein